MKTDFYTLGVFGLSSDAFFEKITSNKIDTFIDIRARRAVRGSEYVFVNSNRLQLKLKELGINYIHIPELSPGEEIRAIQNEFDKASNTTIRHRVKLDARFVDVFKKEVLAKYNFSDLFDELNKLNSKRALFFCVESEARACHRSIVTDKLEADYAVKVVHL